MDLSERVEFDSRSDDLEFVISVIGNNDNNNIIKYFADSNE